MSDASNPDNSSTEYRVLARKYRPTDFDQLVGQETLVRTLTNAIANNRIAQAYMLTGVRGIGKTTTARLIARALNCVGPDGTGGPTTEPCGVCEHCTAIAEDRHVDVLEMDAASRTGVGDIRELIEGVRYRPTSARYKVYIIDEVHMLSTQAFNALLKTLEEPPEHVKFIFATTEIRKVPVTVLSRCQRFDLRRVEGTELAQHFARISEKEGVTVDDGALALISRAADGSVRDGLSLLDQAIAHAEDSQVKEDQVREMLGLADRALVFDLFDVLMKGDVKTALEGLDSQYRAGADPAVVIQDLLEFTHWITRAKISPDSLDDPAVAESERTRGKEISETLTMAMLSRAWQMLLKALNEVRTAPQPLQAAEMALVRIAYVADMPTPAELVDQIKSGNVPAPQPPAAPPPSAPAPSSGGGSAVSQTMTGGGGPSGAPHASLAAEPDAGLAGPHSFEEVIQLFRAKKEIRMLAYLTEHLHLVDFKPGRIEFRPGKNAPAELANRLSRMLTDWTGNRWVATISNAEGAATIAEQEKAGVKAQPLVQAVLVAFPGAEVSRPRTLATLESPEISIELPEEEDQE